MLTPDAFDIFQGILALILFLALLQRPWIKSKRNEATKKDYIAGATFATLFFYGIPLFLWIYGLRLTIFSIGACIASERAIEHLIGLIFDLIFDLFDDNHITRIITNIFGFIAYTFLSPIIQSFAGIWLIHNHKSLQAKLKNIGNRSS